MVNCCCVLNCKKSSKTAKNESFYRFPRVNKRFGEEYQELLARRRKAWIAALKRVNVHENQLDSFRVCSEHFTTGKPADFRDINNPDWIPHVNMGYPKTNVNRAYRIDPRKWLANENMKSREQENQQEQLNSDSESWSKC